MFCADGSTLKFLVFVLSNTGVLLCSILEYG